MQFERGDACVGFFRDKKEDEWYENGKEGDENGWQERLYEFLLPWVIAKIVGLDRKINGKGIGTRG